MTLEAGVRIEGLNQLNRTMGKAKADLSDLKDAHRRAGDIVVSESAPRAPRQSGNLAGSVRAARQARRARVVVGSASVPYAGPIHWGWPARGINAQPFVALAAVDSQPRWLPAYQQDVQRALDKVRGV